LHAQPNHHLGPDPKGAQVMRHTVRTRIKLAIREGAPLEHRSGRLRRLRNLRRKQLRQSRRRHRARSRVPLPQDGVPLPSAQYLHLAGRTPRITHPPLQNTNQPIRYPLNTPTLKQVAGIFQRSHNPRRSPLSRAPLRNAHRQVELRAPARYLLRSRLQSTQLKPPHTLVLQRQHHLEQRMTRQRPHGVDDLNKPLKRKLLVRVRRKVVRTYTIKQRAEARIARRVRPKHQRVHEEANKIVQRCVRAPRNRAPDRYVSPSSKTRQQRYKPSLQHHEQARSAPTRKLQQPSMQRRRQLKPNAPTAIARYRRPAMVEWKLNLIRNSRKPFPPEQELPRDRALPLALIPQNTPLPQRIVGILHRKRRQLRRTTRTPRRVELPKVARQWR